MAGERAHEAAPEQPTPVPDDIVDWFVAFLRGISKDETQ